MKRLVSFLALLLPFILGCGSFVQPLVKNGAVPEGKVLLIGKVNVSLISAKFPRANAMTS